MYDEYLSDAELERIIQEYEKQRMVENAVGPSFSLITHFVLILLLFIFIATNPNRKEPPLVVETAVIEEVKLDPEIVEEIEEIEAEFEQEMPSETISAPDVVAGADNSPEDINDMEPSTDDNTDMEEVLDFVKTNSVLTFTGNIGGRGAQGRKNGIGKNGGPTTRLVQKDLEEALRWLARVQNENGSWGTGKGFAPDYGHPAHTGLALLVFLAHGETPLSEQYGTTVQKAIRWLAEYGTNSELNVKRRPMGYAHGIATYAICEAYSMTKIPFVQVAMENCVYHIVEGQMANGGFGYGYTSGPRWDMSVSGWNMQALKAARMAGCTTDGLTEALQKSIRFCKMAYGGNGGFGYAEKPGNAPNMGGVGALAMQLIGDGNSQQVLRGAERIGDVRFKAYQEVLKDPSKWNKVAGQNLYGWYYDTQVIFNSQNIDKKRWKAWRDTFEKVLHNSQNPEGYWETDGKHKIGDATTDGRVLSTCLAALQLTVYYRYLPSFDKSKIDESKVATEDIDNLGMVIEL